MPNLQGILIPEHLNSPLQGEARSKALSLGCSAIIDWTDNIVSCPYLNYVALTHFGHRLPVIWRNETLLLYNRYLWFLRFARNHSSKHGQDTGLEQQAFQILEHSELDIEWQVVASIEELAHKVT